MFPLSLSLLVHTFELRFFRCVIHPMTIHQMLSQQKFQHQPSNRQKNGRCRLSELGITQQSVMLNTLILHVSTSNQTSFFLLVCSLDLDILKMFHLKGSYLFPGEVNEPNIKQEWTANLFQWKGFRRRIDFDFENSVSQVEAAKKKNQFSQNEIN